MPKAPPRQFAAAHRGRVLSVAFSRPDGKKLASSAGDAAIRIWDVDDPSAASEILGAGTVGDVRAVAFSPDGQRLGSGSEDASIRIWELGALPAPSQALVGHRGSVQSV